MSTTPKVCENPTDLIEALRRFKDAFKTYFPDLPDDAALAFDFPTGNIMNLLSKAGTVAIRVYPALTESNALTIVLVCVDSEGNEIIRPSIQGDAFESDCCIEPPKPGTSTTLSRLVDAR